MSKTKFDTSTRFALHEAYQEKCFYCSKPVDWISLHIDHLIPESIDEHKLQDIKAEFDLNEDFEINSIVNLVPSHSTCNQRKNDELFSKNTVLFYLEITKSKEIIIKSKIDKLKLDKNKNKITSKLNIALENNLIQTDEIELILSQIKNNKWKEIEIKIPNAFEFIDEIIEVFYFNQDYSSLYNKKIMISDDEYLLLSNDKNQEVKVSTLNDWQDKTKKGFYPLSNYSMKMSFYFTFLESLLEALKSAQLPKISFINEPWCSLDDLNLLSPSILEDHEDLLSDYIKNGDSIGDLIKKGIVKRNFNDNQLISIELEGIETSFSEQFRADFNNDGIEDIFVRFWVRAVNGTMGYGYTNILTRYSNHHLIEVIKE